MSPKFQKQTNSEMPLESWEQREGQTQGLDQNAFKAQMPEKWIFSEQTTKGIYQIMILT